MINGKYPRVVIFEHNTYSVKPVYNDYPRGTKIVVVVDRGHIQFRTSK